MGELQRDMTKIAMEAFEEKLLPLEVKIERMVKGSDERLKKIANRMLNKR